MIKCNKRVIILTSIICVVILLSMSISYLKSNEDNKDRDTIVFLGNKDIAPILYDKNGTAKGIVVDIAKALEEKIGYNIKIQAIDWTKAQNKVLAGEADVLLQINPSPEREKIYDFSDELLESEFSIFIEIGNSRIKSVDDLKKRSVGVEEGGYAKHLLERYNEINIVTISNVRNGFQKIKSGELDAVVCDRWIGEYELAQSNIKGIQVVDQAIEIQYSRIAVKKGNEELLNVINNGLSEIKDDNTMNEVISHWRGKNIIYFTEEKVIHIIFIIIIGIIIFILTISIFFINRYKKLSERLELDIEQRTKELYETNELLQKANMELEKISMTDELTNIYNRRYLEVSIEKAWRMALRWRQPFSLIMIDIDNFKMFNDTYGHLAGDQCLKNIAKEIKNVVKRSGDFVVRYGGEEFLVILFNTPKEDAIFVAEKIRRKVESLNIKYEGTETNVTVSLGVASIVPEKIMKPSDLIYAADEAMYEAKRAGRNRVVVYDG